MAANPKDSSARKLIGKFARALLASTCLTVASTGAALAGTITYTELPPPLNFGATFATATPLAAAAIPGTTIVNGSLNDTNDFVDWFELTGLGTGTFTLTASSLATQRISIFNSADVLIEGGNPSGNFGSGLPGGMPVSFGATAIPGNQELFIEVETENESSGNYTVTVNTTGAGVPEPSTIATVGLGLAGAFALRRKLRKQ